MALAAFDLASSVTATEVYSGSDILCILAATCMAGAVYTHTIAYALRFPNDRWPHLAVVACLNIVSMVSLGGNAGLLWASFVAHGGIPPPESSAPGINRPNIQLSYSYAMLQISLPIFSGVLSQCFFGARAFRASGNRWWIAASIGTLTLAHLTVGITGMAWLSVKAWPTVESGVVFGYPIHAVQGIEMPFIAFALLISAIDDVLIASILAWSLTRQQQGFHHRTDAVLARIARAAITTGGISALTACFVAVLTLATHFNFWWFADQPKGRARLLGLPDGLLYVLPQVYPLIVVITLNLRASWASLYTTPQEVTPARGVSAKADSIPFGMAPESFGMDSIPIAPSSQYERGMSPHSPLTRASTSGEPRDAPRFSAFPFGR